MARMLMEVQGSDGQIELLEDRVIIHRRGLLNAFKHGLNARREMPLSSITSVNFRTASFFKLGEIDFDYAGRSQLNRRQNTVIFTRKHQAEFVALKERIFELMQKNRSR